MDGTYALCVMWVGAEYAASFGAARSRVDLVGWLSSVQTGGCSVLVPQRSRSAQSGRKAEWNGMGWGECVS